MTDTMIIIILDQMHANSLFMVVSRVNAITLDYYWPMPIGIWCLQMAGQQPVGFLVNDGFVFSEGGRSVYAISLIYQTHFPHRYANKNQG